MNVRLICFLCTVITASYCGAYQEIPQVVLDDTSNVAQFSYNANSTAPVTTITRQQIKTSGAHTIAQVLALAGLQLRDVTGDGSNLQISMRGFGGNTGQNTLVLLNGHPLVYPDLGTFNFNQISVSSIDAIQIYNSSMSVLYGDQAVGGVINIITNQKLTNAQYAGLSAGSYHTYQASAGVSRNLANNLAYHLDMLGNSTSGYREHNANQDMNVDLGVRKKFNDNSINVDYQFYRQILLYAGALTAEQAAQNPRQPQNFTNFFTDNIQNLQADYTHQLSDNWRIDFNTIVNQMDGAGVLTNNFTNHRNAVNFNPVIQGLFSLGDYTLISLSGLDVSNGDYKFASSTYNSNSQQTAYSGYTQLNLPLANTWHIMSGVRYARAFSGQNSGAVNNNATNDAFVSNIGVLWQPTQYIDAYLRRAGNYRFPKTDENIDTATNLPLKTQTGVSYETGFSWHVTKWKGLVNIYHLILNNEITSIPIPNSTTSFALNQNLPQTTRNGFDINLTYQPWQPFTLQGIYHYVNGVFSAGPDQGNAIPFVAKQNYILSEIYAITARWSWSIEDNFTDARTLDNDPEQRSPKLPSYSLINSNLQYHYRNWQVDFRINNIFNHQYDAYAFDVYNGAQTTSYFYPAVGRNYLVSLLVNM